MRDGARSGGYRREGQWGESLGWGEVRSNQECRVPAPGQGMATLGRAVGGALGCVNHLPRNLPHRSSPMIVTSLRPYPYPRALALKKVDSIMPGLDTKENFLAVGLLRGKISTSQKSNKAPRP